MQQGNRRRRSIRHPARAGKGGVQVCDLAHEFRNEAEILRKWGELELARAVLHAADRLEMQERLAKLEELSLREASARSGFSYSAVEKMVRQGRIPNAGVKGSPRVRAGDLPSRPPTLINGRSGPDLASRALIGR
jgi:hypothetical protein